MWLLIPGLWQLLSQQMCADRHALLPPGPLEAAGHSAVVCVSALGEVESFGERVLVHMCPQTSVTLGQLGGWVSSWLPV